MEFVAYLRVSTRRQGCSGLGLEAQREIIRGYLHGAAALEFVEVESGRKTDAGRPQLRAALQACRERHARLIVAKLDRLARNVGFLSALLETDVEITFCDFPQANKMVLHIMGAISQYEAELISTRTRQALAAKKEQGHQLGHVATLTANRAKAIEASRAARRKKSTENANNQRALAMIGAMRASGLTTREMASRLNESGFATATGKAFCSATVSRLAARL